MARKKLSATLKKVIERRDGVRVNRVVAIKHRLVRRAGKKVPSVWSLSTTKNMSVSGLLFLSPVPYNPGDVIQLEVVLSGVIDIYNGLGEVVRLGEIAGSSFDVAARYVEEKPKPRFAKKHLLKKK